jgi:hypothetical protein
MGGVGVEQAALGEADGDPLGHPGVGPEIQGRGGDDRHPAQHADPLPRPHEPGLAPAVGAVPQAGRRPALDLSCDPACLIREHAELLDGQHVGGEVDQLPDEEAPAVPPAVGGVAQVQRGDPHWGCDATRA